ncbi:MAG: reverse transcriptase domain-containing protein [Ardenticatenaceae bacterium]|nr:reverse transcriptase domain-containing protein [Ardenticatenaceae bacterium]
MQKAEYVLNAMHKLGMVDKPLTRVYRQLFNQNLYLRAYAKLYPNAGALTPGSTAETVDGMNLRRIETIIEELRYERFQWRPARRVYIKKKQGGRRPLGMPDFRDKLMQEVINSLLSAYYEPRFSRNSHGFRPQRGCHTALSQISVQFTGTVWFIEGDIKGCFDHIDHDILMAIISRNIHDQRLLNLIRSGLEAGILEDFRYEKSYSGTPQGGVLSPLLANIYLNELDQYVEQVLQPKWRKGKARRRNKAYKAYEYQISQAWKRGDREACKRLKRERRELPSLDSHDPTYRRLWYMRYADDYLLGYIGPKQEAETIKAELGDYLATTLKLQQSPEKTLITHAKTEQAHFLGYAVSVYHANHVMSRGTGLYIKRRSANGRIRLGIPAGLIREKIKYYKRHDVVVSEYVLTHQSVANIIKQYQERFRGLAEYYKFAVDRYRLGGLKGIMQEALVKTLAQKLKISARRVYRKYRSTKDVNGRRYNILVETVETKTGIRRFEWGGVPLTHVKPSRDEVIDDTKPKVRWSMGGELVQRLLAEECEICGSSQRIEVHHVRNLADLKKRWRGRKAKPTWVKLMVARNRKTLVVCRKCHAAIHAGKMDIPVQQVNWRAG